MNEQAQAPVAAQAEDFLSDRGADWLAAVLPRHSRRAYDPTPIDRRSRERIADLCESWRPHADARVVWVDRPAADVFTGILGSYGKVTGAPHLLVFAGAADAPFANQHVGFTGEAVVLEATALGLSTCWVGGFFSAAKVAGLVDLEPAEKIFAVSPLGYGAARPWGAGGAAPAIHPRPRKSVAQIATGGAPEAWPSWAVAAVETARLAPSALNRQPWRFRMEGEALVVSADRSLPITHVAKRLDIGIAMLHVELARLAHGIEGRWTDLEGRDVARFDPAGA